jgi:thymidylate synthase (FAD)
MSEITTTDFQVINPFREYISLDQYLFGLLRHCEMEARKSHQSEDLIKEGSATTLLEFIVMKKGDFSVIEHASLTVDVRTDRGITHEQVRHRLFSYTQESTRFVNYVKKMPASFLYPRPDDPEMDIDWLAGIEYVERTYQKLIAKGWRPQEARSVMPNAQKAAIGITGNMRNWRHELIMRTTKESHPQIKEWTIPLLECLKHTCWGWLFTDIEPNQSQEIALSRPR